MERSWGFLIPKYYYNYSFENFYATVIQRAYRSYKKRPKSLAKQVWEVVRNDGTPDRWKYLGIIPFGEAYYYINGKLVKFNWKSDYFNMLYNHTLYSPITWAEEKKNQLLYRLGWALFDRARKTLQQKGYIPKWYTTIKWAQNPEYYLNTEKNPVSTLVVRMEMLAQLDLHINIPPNSNWWYRDKASRERLSQLKMFPNTISSIIL
jgi:hypothetical protein